MMALESLRAELTRSLHAIEADPALDLHLLRGHDLATAVAGKVSVTGGLDQEIGADVRRFAGRVADAEWKDFDPGYQVHSGQALVDSLDALSGLARIHAEVRGNLAGIDDPAAGPVVAMAHSSFADRADGVTAYRLRGRGIATRTGRAARMFLPRGGVLEPIGGEVVYYEPTFQALVFREAVFVTAASTVSTHLDAPERLRAVATATLHRTSKRVRIANLRQLEDAVSRSPQMASKLASLARTLETDPGYETVLTTEHLVEFLQANEHIEIEVRGSGKNAELVFEPSPQKRFLILKLMADDFLTSRLSNRNYEAGSKARLSD